MNNQDSSDSQTEGFIPNKLKISSSSTKQEPQSTQKFTSFQPKYIFGSPMLKKEPLQMLNNVDDIQIKSQNVNVSENKINNYEKITKTVHEQYMNQSAYALIYSRFRQPFSNGLKASFQHEIKLKGSLFNLHKYRKLRQAQMLTDVSKFTPSNSLDNQQLIFDSKFQGGNLLCAFKSLTEKNTYILFMQNDTNTYGYNQWFYFSIKNAKPFIDYTFMIVNFKKKYSFFTKGMQPLIFSYEQYKSKGNGWYRDGSNISYHKSHFEEVQCQPYYTLQFSLTFSHVNDYIAITINPPYSYTKLIKFIEQCKPIAESKQISFEMSSICQSLGGNNVPYLTISNKQSTHQKSIIIILARQHSGQTWSSFLMQEIIRYIIKECNHLSNWLLQNYQFHIFPMVNVDGVIYGNFRCDLSGYDLNRCWKNPSKYVHPQNYYIKEKIQKLSQRKIEYFLDLHTHSKAFGSFAYSCVQSVQGRRLPELMSKITSLFQYSSCTFNIEKQKQLTARAITFQLSKNINTITIELSTYGYKNRITKKYSYFTMKQVNKLSKCFINSFIAYKTGVDIQQFCQLQTNVSSDVVIQQQIVSDSDSQPEIDQIQMSKKIENIFSNHIKRQYYFKNKKMLKIKRKKEQLITNQSQSRNKSMQIDEQSNSNQQINRNRVKTQYSPTNCRIGKKKQDMINFFSESVAIQNQYRFKRTINFKKKAQSLNQSVPLTIKSKLKMLTQTAAKPLNFVEFSLKKLPIFANSIINRGGFKMVLQNKHQSNINSHKKQRYNDKKTNSFQTTHFNGKKEISTDYITNRLDEKIKQTIYNEKTDFPYLCVMSETKRIQQFKRSQQTKLKNQLKTQISYNISSLKQKTFFQSTKPKNKNNVQIMQRSWMKNAVKYYPYCQQTQ